MYLSLRRAKVRRLVQYSPVLGTYLDHISFLFILPVFPELCVLYVQCGFQSTFGTLDRIRKTLTRKIRSLLDPRERGDLNQGIMSGPEQFSRFSCQQMGSLVESGDHLSSDKHREYRSLIQEETPPICLLLSIFSSGPLDLFVYELGSREIKVQAG